MGRLRTLTILLTIGAWGAATDGAPPDDAAAAAAPSRPAPPAPPGEYVKAAAKLLQGGQPELAAKYLKAADDYRDMLSPDELAAFNQCRAQIGGGQAPADPAVAPASVPAAAPSAANPPTSTMGRGGPSADEKQKARWLLQSAREQLKLGDIDRAQALLDEARAMNVRWGLFELDTPTKVAESITEARAAAPPKSGQAGDKTQARARLKEARQLLDANQYDKADQMAREVAGWGHRFSMLEDNPRKVIAAADVLRKRDQLRHAGPKGQPSTEIYDILLQESRQLMAAGQLDAAEAKARQAHATGVTPALTADRAENVLHEIAMMRARGAAPAGAAPAQVAAAPAAVADPAVMPVQAQVEVPATVETPEARAEREGNELLAQGQVEAAKAKFAEATRLQAQAAGQPEVVPPLADPVAAMPPVDPAFQPAADAPAPIGLDPAQPVGLDPAQGAAEAPAASPGESLLEQARSLLTSGNYAAARQAAEQARAGGYGLESQAGDLISQIALAEQAGTLSLYEAALDALRKGEPARARDLLNELAAGNVDESTMQKVQDLLARLPKDAAGKAVVGATELDAEAVAAQKLNAEVGTKVAESRRLMETDPDKAIALLEQTLKSVQAAQLSPAVAKTMTRRIEVAVELAKKDKVAFDAKMKDKDARAEIERKRLRILEASAAKQKQMKELMDKARDAMAESRFEDAEMLARRAAEIDPDEVAAVAMVTLARTRRHYETSKRNIDQKNEGALLAFEDVDRASVVDKDVIERSIGYANGGKGWDALTRRRADLAERLRIKRDPKTEAIRQKLEETVSLNVDKQPLSEALDFLRNYSGLNIVLDKSALADVGMTESTPVDLKVNGLKLKHALKLLLEPLHLTYDIRDEVVMLTSPTSNKKALITQAYGVADLVVPVSRGEGMNPEGVKAAAKPDEPTFPTPGSRGEADAGGTKPHVTPEMYVPLIQLIKATVAPGSWRDDDGLTTSTGGAFGMGGGFGGAEEDQTNPVGSITPFYLSISLIIRHTAEVHDEVVDLLRQLRRLQDLQVSIEVRFITVSDNFFEQIGVDFDFSIQSDAVGKHSSLFIPNPAAIPTAGGGTTGGGGTTTSVSPYLVNPIRDHAIGNKVLTVGRAGNGGIGNFTNDLQIPFQQDSAGVITPFNALTANTGATFGISFLSDLEVYLFLTAVQGDTRSNLVQAPKVTSFNGAPAFVVNTTNRNYVANLQPIVANGAVAFQPSISSFQDGVTMFVTPVVSADRRYVRMTMMPQFQTFIQFDTFQIPAAVSGFLGGSGTVNAQVQLPVFSMTLVSTTVTVPDGGTVLLGGVKRLREERREFGVPILSKTPYINRLFRNIGIGRTTDSLMLMVTPRIIILEEEEERLGIPAVPTVPF